MSVTVVRYTVRADRLEENLKLVAAVYDELATVRPAGLRYATFRGGPEGLNFVHVAVVDDSAGGGDRPHPLTSQPAFQRFSAGIGERCSAAPEVAAMEVVGSYSFPVSAP